MTQQTDVFDYIIRPALEECGIAPAPQWLVEGDHTLEGGVRAMEALLAAEKQPTAVMCSNDMTAIGVLHNSIAPVCAFPRFFPSSASTTFTWPRS